MRAAWRPDPFRGLGLYKPPRRDPVIGREVTWTENGRDLAGQVWARCPYGAWYWVVTVGGWEFRTASYDKAADTFTIGPEIWNPRGECARDGKAAS